MYHSTGFLGAVDRAGNTEGKIYFFLWVGYNKDYREGRGTRG